MCRDQRRHYASDCRHDHRNSGCYCTPHPHHPKPVMTRSFLHDGPPQPRWTLELGPTGQLFLYSSKVQRPHRTAPTPSTMNPTHSPHTDNLTIFRGISQVQPTIMGGAPAPRLSVPSLFRLTLISTTKRREPTRSQIPAQRLSRRYRGQCQKFELYSCSGNRAFTLSQAAKSGSQPGLLGGRSTSPAGHRNGGPS